jgi:Zn-dependent peptidase ImmA (M78 family)
MDPYELLLRHGDITLVRTQLPAGEVGRWYPAPRVILIQEGLTQREERCTVMHELIHALRADLHIDDPRLAVRQERTCHEIAARALIPLERLAEQACWASDDHQLAEALDVDLDTLRVFMASLTDCELAAVDGMIDLEETA